MRRLEFVQVDVFTSRPLEGNPLAVFTDARGVSDDEMQSIAREMNLSETTFVLPAAGDGVPVRIFTVDEELPFAGHPTLGTAWVITGGGRAAEVKLQLKVGTVPVRFSARSEGAVFGEMQQPDPEFGSIHDREAVARAVGVRVEQISSDLPIQTVSTGVPFTVVPIASLAALRSIRADWTRLADYHQRSDAKFFYFVCRETQDAEAALRARMIFYNGEDPATGSAAGCTAAWMVKHGVAAPEQRALIEQGMEVRRPSRMHVRASRNGERISNVRVGGEVVEVLRGVVTLP